MTRNALLAIATLVGVLALAGCSREKIDWKSAESADTVEAYDHFIGRHPEGELATQARSRVAQLNEDRDWKRATTADTADAYRQFLAQHDSGKWAEEARIRVENFSLNGTAEGPAAPAATMSAQAESLPAVPAAASKSAAGAQPSVSAKASAPEQRVVVAKSVAAAAKPLPAPAAPPGAAPPQFGIQLGAFRSQDAALKSWKQIQAKHDSDLHGLFARAVPVSQSSGQLFRLQAPVGDEARARAICASLSRKSQPCVVVLPATP